MGRRQNSELAAPGIGDVASAGSRLGAWLVRPLGWGCGFGLSCKGKKACKAMAGLLIHTVQKQGGGVG